ncbi:MAG TPA: hypothetical protein VF255_02840 [Solirubrobacterales bacterium]
MKSFVREHGKTFALVFAFTLVATVLTGGSMVVFYLASLASLSVGLWWEIRRGAL